MSFEVDNPERWEELKAHIILKLEDGTYQPLIAKTFSLGYVPEAYTFMEAGTQQGKIILKALKKRILKKLVFLGRCCDDEIVSLTYNDAL